MSELAWPGGSSPNNRQGSAWWVLIFLVAETKVPVTNMLKERESLLKAIRCYLRKQLHNKPNTLHEYTCPFKVNQTHHRHSLSTDHVEGQLRVNTTLCCGAVIFLYTGNGMQCESVEPTDYPC